MFQNKWQASILSFATQRGNWSLRNIVSCPKAKIQTAKNFKGDPGVPVPKLPPPSWQNSTFFTETEGFFSISKRLRLWAERGENSHPPGWCGFQPPPVTYLILIFPVLEAQFCSLSLSTNTKDAGIPSWTPAWQDSNLSYLKRMHPLLFKK